MSVYPPPPNVLDSKELNILKIVYKNPPAYTIGVHLQNIVQSSERETTGILDVQEHKKNYFCPVINMDVTIKIK